ncbi:MULTISPECIES: glutathione S-transferase family protein [unclassified Vibrio]|uniref:glutathione transferase n=1 Tax=Vibrio sp. HB236076 TaxID=3232307 RepID=A0AB39H6D7_9VIBR|nr:glutathione S-transferase [Vibrio sp. HB161653]MDP5253414.1 glutathione S-transferase [Vibrio sp. HB161653]
MITLHHIPDTRSNRIIWLLEELGLTYHIENYRRDPVTKEADPKLKNIHPLGKTPILTDGDVCLAESGAIIEYLLDHYDSNQQFRPSSYPKKQDYLYWLHFSEGSLMPLLIMGYVHHIALDKGVPWLVKPIIKKFVMGLQRLFIAPRLKPQLDMIETHLSQQAYFTGADFSAADVQMMIPLQFYQQRFGTDAYPFITAYIEKNTQRPAYQTSLKKHG